MSKHLFIYLFICGREETGSHVNPHPLCQSPAMTHGYTAVMRAAAGPFKHCLTTCFKYLSAHYSHPFVNVKFKYNSTSLTASEEIYSAATEADKFSRPLDMTVV